MALLMLNARIPAIATNQKITRWDQIFTPCIAGKTVLVIGVGEMGATVAAAKALGLRIVGVRRSSAQSRGRPHGADRRVRRGAARGRFCRQRRTL